MGKAMIEWREDLEWAQSTHISQDEDPRLRELVRGLPLPKTLSQIQIP